MLSRRQIVVLMLALVAAGPMAGPVQAQGFPSKPITVLIAYPTGGPADLIARSMGEVLRERMGQPVIVDSRPGAGGQIAAAALLRAPADGYTLLLADNATLGINKAIYPGFNYDPLTDLAAVAPLMSMPMVLYVPKSSPFNSVAELVAAAKLKPLNYASQGAGSIGHLLGEGLKADAGIQLNHIPYKGSAPAMADLLGGQVDLLFDGIGPGLPHLKTEKLKVLAVAGPQRLPQIPSVPTTAENGLPNVVLSLWLGVVVRAGTPAQIVQRFHDEIAYAMKQPTVNKRFADLGFQFLSMNADEFRGFVKRESEKSAELVKARRIVLE